MKRNFAIFLTLAAVFALSQGYATTYSVWQGTPSGQATGLDPMRNYPEEPLAFNLTGQTTSTATASTAVTAIAGRKNVKVYVDYSGTAGTAYVTIGSTTAAAGTGIPIHVPVSTTTTAVTPGPVIDLDLDASVSMSVINASGIRYTIIQTGRKL